MVRAIMKEEAAMLTRLTQILATRRRNHINMQALRHLDDGQLADVGLRRSRMDGVIERLGESA